MQTKIELQRVLIHRDDDIIERHQAYAEASLTLFRDLSDNARIAELEINNENLKEAIARPAAFVEKQHRAQTSLNPTFLHEKEKGMTLDNFMKNYTPKFPDASKFIAAAEALSKYITRTGIADAIILDDGEPAVSQAALNNFIEKQSYYIYDERSIKIWNAYKAMSDGINHFNETIRLKEVGGNKETVGLTPENFLQWLEYDRNGSYRPRRYTFKERTESFEKQAKQIAAL